MSSSEEKEVDRIREHYGSRSLRYDYWDPWVLMTGQELERAMIRTLLAKGQLPPEGRTVFDVGCGAGGHLLKFLRLGFEPGRLRGVDLIPERVARARATLPSAVVVRAGSASTIDAADCSVDIVFQSLVFSSILDASLRSSIASEMWRICKPGGGILWYDFTYDNPRNPAVRGVPMSLVRDLFPDARISFQRVTLAPPIARVAARIHTAMYGALSALPFLRTHVLAWISKSS